MSIPFPVHIPLVEHLGMRLERFADGEAELSLTLDADVHTNSFKVAHGGLLMMMLDVAMAHAARSRNKDAPDGGPGIVTIEMKTSFMRPGQGTLRAVGAFPALGTRVARGQTLAMLVPRLGGDADVASLQAALSSASSQATLADAEAARMQRLHAQEAVSLRRLQEARATQQVAAAELRAARQRLSQLGDGSSGIALKAPASGTLALVKVANGAAVEEGDALFHIVDRRELWLQANVAEADVARLRQPDAVAFDVPGLDAPVEIRAGVNGRLVGVGGMIDPESRSVPVIFALSNPDPRIALNQAVQARVFTGSTRSALSVPASAVIDDGGQRVVYVMRGGESFSRVPVRLGLRDGDRYEVLEGVKAGDRVVSRGAMQVRLAAATPEAMGHGHAH